MVLKRSLSLKIRKINRDNGFANLPDIRLKPARPNARINIHDTRLTTIVSWFKLRE